MKRFLSLTIVAFFIAAAPAAAQSIFFGAGPTFPTSDFGDIADTGWMIFGGGTYDLSEQLSIYGEGFWGQNGVTDSEGDLNPSGIMGGLLYGFSADESAPISPYVFGGAGLLTLSNGESESGFGFQGGAGLGFDLGGLDAFAEGRYTSGSIELGTVDATVGFFAIVVGLSFGFGS